MPQTPMARRLGPLLALCGGGLVLAGCVNGLAQRQNELARWVGRPEIELVQAMGAPARVYETDGIKILTYEESRTDIVPGTPMYPGFGPYWWGPGSGLPPTVVNLKCDTNFTIAGGVVRSFSLRGNACG